MKDARQDIIRQAYALFLQKGYKAVTMQDILEVTGLSKGAIYHHFKSKEDIFEASVRFFFLGGIARDFESYPKDNLKEFIAMELKYILDKRDYLIAYSRGHGGPVSSNYFTVIFEAAQLIPAFRADLDAYRKREYTVWVRVIRNALKSGEIHSGMKAEQVARLFIYVHRGLGMQLILNDRFAEIHKELRTMWMAIYKGLQKNQA